MELEYKYGVILVTSVPMRIEPSEKAEMVNQLLFGDLFEILKVKKNWLLIRSCFDFYEGYVSVSSVEIINYKQYKKLITNNSFISKSYSQAVIQSKNKERVIVTAGSTIPGFNGKSSFKIAGKSYRFKGRPTKFDFLNRESLVNCAIQFKNSPYLWGGRTPFGFDCSGFTQIVYKLCGFKIPRDCSKQVREGDVVTWVIEGKPGDLAFFQNNEGLINHVGILMGEGKIIHCSGKVRIDFIDHEGIINCDTKRYTHQLRVVKNLLG
jgi:cell wall-associated NlpC family hydrolase